MDNKQIESITLYLVNNHVEVFKNHLVVPILAQINLSNGTFKNKSIGLINLKGHTTKLIYTAHIVKVEIKYKENE